MTTFYSWFKGCPGRPGEWRPEMGERPGDGDLDGRTERGGWEMGGVEGRGRTRTGV